MSFILSSLRTAGIIVSPLKATIARSLLKILRTCQLMRYVILTSRRDIAVARLLEGPWVRSNTHTYTKKRDGIDDANATTSATTGKRATWRMADDADPIRSNDDNVKKSDLEHIYFWCALARSVFAARVRKEETTRRASDGRTWIPNACFLACSMIFIYERNL